MLSVTVAPGKVFGAGERVDIAKLNQLGSPTIEIEGTVTSDQIEDKAVTVPRTDFDPDNVDGDDLRSGGVLPVFDIITARPTFNARGYHGANDRAKIQAAINAAILEGGGVILIDRDFSLDDMVGGVTDSGFYYYLLANAAARCQLTFRGLFGCRLYNTSNANSANPVAILGLKNALVDVVFEGLTFEQVDPAGGARDHATVGIMLNDTGAGALQRVRIMGCPFKGLSNPIYGAASGVTIEDNHFLYPVGNPGGGSFLSYAVTANPTYGLAADWTVKNNRMDGAAGATVAAGAGVAAYGFSLLQAQGAQVVGNIIRRVSGWAVGFRERPIGSSNSWVSAPRELLARGNRIEFEDIAGQAAAGERGGIYSYDGGLSVEGNRIAGCYKGVYVNGLPAGFTIGSDLTTRLRKIKVRGNDIELAADLKMDDATLWQDQARGGIDLQICRRAEVTGNTVQFSGRTSAAVAKNWVLPGILLYGVDDARVGENEVFGPVDTMAANTDLLWLAGVALESCRKCEIAPNYFRNLNVGVDGSEADSAAIAASSNEIAEQRMEDVVWPWAAMSVKANPVVGVAALHKRLRGPAYRARKARTSFVCDAATLGGGFAGGYVRVGSFLNGLFGRVRVWCEDNPNQTVAMLEVAYGNNGTAGDGNMVQQSFFAYGTAAFSKARVCVQNTPTDATSGKVCHLDVYVPGLNSQRIWIEVEGPANLEGLWGAPNLPASMPSGFQDSNPTGLQEMIFAAGFVSLGGAGIQIAGDAAWNHSHMIYGAQHMWRRASDGAMLYNGAPPANDSDGHQF